MNDTTLWPLAFSSLGVPGADVAEIHAITVSSGVTSVELRCADGELITPQTTASEASALRTRLEEAGIDPICVASYVRIARPDGDPVAEAIHHVRIAEALGSRFVRVFGGVEGVSESEHLAATRLAKVAAGMGDSPVIVLIETHDVFLTGSALARILDEAGSERLGALWDVVNPWRAGENPASTARVLAPWLRHVQIKDAASMTDLAPLLPGLGAIPIYDALDSLHAIGYSGSIALEWERAWYPDVAPLPEALDAFTALLGRWADSKREER
jgi:sugar phosphate isomerase/epimerase